MVGRRRVGQIKSFKNGVFFHSNHILILTVCGFRLEKCDFDEINWRHKWKLVIGYCLRSRYT